MTQPSRHPPRDPRPGERRAALRMAHAAHRRGGLFEALLRRGGARNPDHRVLAHPGRRRRFRLLCSLRRGDKNSVQSKRRGRIPGSSASAEINVNANAAKVEHTFRWGDSRDDAVEKHVVDIRWDDETPSDSKLIEHEANPQPSNKE